MKINKIHISSLVIILFFLIIPFFIEAADDCKGVKTYGEQPCDVTLSNAGFCYNETCILNPQTEINKPCGNEVGSTCQTSYGCKDKDFHLLSGISCGNNLFCCETTRNDCMAKFGGSCRTATGPNCNSYGDGKIMNLGVGYCDSESLKCCVNSCENATGGSGQCLSESSCKDSSTYSYECGAKGNVCCVEEKNSCETAGGSCIDEKFKSECSGQEGTLSQNNSCGLGKTCCTLGECAGGCAVEDSISCAKKSSSGGNLFCKINNGENQVCCVDDNACEKIDGKCESECSNGYTLSENTDVNNACVEDKGIAFQCCVESACLKIGGSCVSETSECKNRLPRYDDSCYGDLTCCGSVISAAYKYESPLEVSSLTDWITNLLSGIQSIVGWLAVIMIFIGGIMYILSGGSQGQATLAKEIIKWALIGFALAVAAPSFLKELKDLMSSGGTATDLIDNANSLKSIAVNVLKFLLSIIGVLALVGFVLGGILYLSAFGDQGKTDSAKKMVIYSIIAIGVSGASVIALNSILAFLSGNLK